MTELVSFPRVAVAGRETPMEIVGVEPDRDYVLNGASKRKPQHTWERNLRADAQGRIAWMETFPAQDEYLLDLYALGASRVVGTFYLFAVKSSLAGLVPWRCDFHIHTYYSDGHESPLEMAIRGRELGLDVIAITDHNRHAPSYEAMRGVERISLNLVCLPGEEVSFDNGHMLSIGAQGAVRELWDSETGAAQVSELAATLESAHLAEGLTASEYAAPLWVTKTVRRFGGRAFLAHPYWVSRRGFHLDLRFYGQLVEDGAIDGVELIGDVEYNDNLLSLARHAELAAKGHLLPIIGCSDTHAARERTYGCHWTVVWAPEASQQGILDAIENRRSVACSTVGPTGPHEGLRVYGPPELVEYAFFLAREFFPLHDALCAEEASAAWETRAGREPVGRRDYFGAMAELYKRSFAFAP